MPRPSHSLRHTTICFSRSPLPFGDAGPAGPACAAPPTAALLRQSAVQGRPWSPALWFVLFCLVLVCPRLSLFLRWFGLSWLSCLFCLVGLPCYPSHFRLAYCRSWKPLPRSAISFVAIIGVIRWPPVCCPPLLCVLISSSAFKLFCSKIDCVRDMLG